MAMFKMRRIVLPAACKQDTPRTVRILGKTKWSAWAALIQPVDAADYSAAWYNVNQLSKALDRLNELRGEDIQAQRKYLRKLRARWRRYARGESVHFNVRGTHPLKRGQQPVLKPLKRPSIVLPQGL